MVSKSIFQGQAFSMSKSVLGISSCHHWGTYHIAPSAIKVYKFRSITVSKFHGKVQFTSHVTGFHCEPRKKLWSMMTQSSFKSQPAEPGQLTGHHPEPLSSQKIEDGSGELSTCMVLPAQKQANALSQSVSNCVERLPGSRWS